MSEQTREHRRVWAAIVTLEEDLPDALLDDEIADAALEGFRALTCLTYGHWPVNDHCCLAEHDYCMVCLKPMPNAATTAPTPDQETR